MALAIENARLVHRTKGTQLTELLNKSIDWTRNGERLRQWPRRMTGTGIVQHTRVEGTLIWGSFKSR